MASKRTAFFVSDRTGITAEVLGHSLLTQFEGFAFDHRTLPFVDTVEKAKTAVEQINQSAKNDDGRPLVFSTLVDKSISAIVASANALFLDCFQVFFAPLEAELGVESSHTVGKSHAVSDSPNYFRRIEAVNYSLAHDDGVTSRDLGEA